MANIGEVVRTLDLVPLTTEEAPAEPAPPAVEHVTAVAAGAR